MTDCQEIPSRESNPFATCWTRPGALPFATTTQANVKSCLDRLLANGWRGQIVGPHGVGKSTLLHAIRNRAIRDGERISWLRAGNQQTPAPRPANVPSETIVLIDSFEKLSPWRRLAWRHRRGGLVVTTHAPTRLPVLATLHPSLDDARRLFSRLIESVETPVTQSDLIRAFGRSAGNLREVWFELYSIHEQRTRATANQSCVAS